MKPTLLLFSVIAILILPRADIAADASPPPLTREEQEVVTISEAMTDAFNRRDFAAFTSHAAPELIGTTDAGWAWERPASLEREEISPNLLLPADFLQVRDRRDLHIRLHGDVAVLNYRITVIERFGETTITSESRIAESFQKRAGAWLLIAQSETTVPVNLRRTVTVAREILAEIVGQYEWRPGMVDTVTLEGDHLVSQMTGDATKKEILFVDDETTIVRDDLGWVTNVRDEHGRITGYIYHRTDGQELAAKKIR